MSSASAGLKRVPWSSTSISAGLDAEHPDDAGDAAAAGQQAEGRLGQADLGRGVVDDDPVVAGQRDLEAAAEGGAVDRGHDRAWERLEPAQVGLDRLDAGEDRRGVVGRRLHHQREVAAGEEGLLGAGDHDAGDVVARRGQLGVQPVDGRVHRVAGRARSSCWRWRSGRRG